MPRFLPASDLERSKDVSCLMGDSKAVLHGRSHKATVGGWLKSARQSGSSDGSRVSVILGAGPGLIQSVSQAPWPGLSAWAEVGGMAPVPCPKPHFLQPIST